MLDNNLNLNLLRVFHAVARLLSFTRAAEDLNLTQPGISTHIKELESHCKTRLFHRLGKKVVLTEAGEILFSGTQSIFRSLAESGTKINDLQGLVAGALSIGASISIGTYILPEMLAKFRHSYPAVDIKMGLSLSQEVVEKTLNNAIELGFVHHYIDDNSLVVKAFMEDQLLLVVSRQHAWAKRKSPVLLQHIANQPFLLAGRGSGTREIVEELLKKEGISLKNIMELGTTDGIKKAVEANLGISIVSKYVVALEVKLGLIKAIPLRGIDLKRDLYLVFHKDRYLSEAARAFISLLKRESMILASKPSSLVIKKNHKIRLVKI
jgi:DNA-binding transcriptional LysR family regulator